MRNVLTGIVCLLVAGSLFAQCNQASLLVSGISGEMTAPCAGALSFTSATFNPPTTTGGGGGAVHSIPGSLKVNRFFDSASPGLMLACSSGKHIPTVKLSNPPMSITFSDVMVSSDSLGVTQFQGTYQTTEALEFKYAKYTLDSGDGTRVTGSVMGNARASAMSVVAVNGDGHAQPVQSLSLTVRPGGTTFNSVQLAPPPPGTAAVNRASSPTLTTALQPGASAAPTESLSFNYGKIQFKYHGGGSAEFAFSGGQVVNGNLRVARASYTGPTTVAAHP